MNAHCSNPGPNNSFGGARTPTSARTSRMAAPFAGRSASGPNGADGDPPRIEIPRPSNGLADVGVRAPIESLRLGPVIRRRAFSLIEIMVAVSLLSVIIVGLLLMFYHVQRAFRAGTAQADILESGRATMSLVTRDLQEMTACHLTNVFNCLIEPSLPNNSPSFQDLATGSRRTNWFQDIAFLSRVNDEWTATAYRVAYGADGVGTLYRMVQRTNRWTLFQDSSNAVRELTMIASRDFYTGANSNLYNRVVEGVVAFDVRPLDTNGLAFPNMDPLARGSSNPAYRWKPNVEVNNGNGTFFFYNDATPAYVDVELAILEPAALTRFRVQEDIGGAQARNYLGRQIGRTHVFRQRVAILPSAIELSVR